MVKEQLLQKLPHRASNPGESRGSYVRFNSMGEVLETATCRARHALETAARGVVERTFVGSRAAWGEIR